MENNPENICHECLQLCSGKDWCNPCNAKRFQNDFKNWTSGNKVIDDFILKIQFKAWDNEEVIEWIPLNKFNNIQSLITTRTFEPIFEAKWIDGYIVKWDYMNNKWERSVNETVYFVDLHNSTNISMEFMENRFGLYDTAICGLTKNPMNDSYVAVMKQHYSYACPKCQQPYRYQYITWCNPCNTKQLRSEFKNWTSGNEMIDNFIQKKQLEAYMNNDIIEWIPYEKLKHIKYLAKGGFGIIYQAIWVDGHIVKWYSKNNKWKRDNANIMVCLKKLNNSNGALKEFLQEVENQLKFKGLAAPIYGITKDIDTYMMVMKYAPYGSLRDMLNNKYHNLSWKDKLANLYNISLSLKDIHSTGFVHKDFHAGNIVMNDLTLSKITDFGLCKPISLNSTLEHGSKHKYGVTPYVSPEVLRENAYTRESEIYSFGIIMSEILTSYPPYHDLPHNNDLVLDICKGLRPKIRCKIPQLLQNLMERCWDAIPSKRPTADELFEIMHQYWKDNLNDSSELSKQIREIESSEEKLQIYDSNRSSPNYDTHPLASYTSRILDYKNLPEPRNATYKGAIDHDLEI